MEDGQQQRLDLFVEGKLCARIVDVSGQIDEGVSTPISYAVEMLHGLIWEECDERFAQIVDAERFAACLLNVDEAHHLRSRYVPHEAVQNS
jgi:hypothetical protein